MKIKFAALYCFAVAIFLSGCATARFNEMVNTWIGHHTDELLGKWGAPSNVIQLSNGGSVMEYARAKVVNNPGFVYSLPSTNSYSVHGNGNAGIGNSMSANVYGTQTTQVPYAVGPSSETRWCTVRFTVNTQSVITDVAYVGNACY